MKTRALSPKELWELPQDDCFDIEIESVVVKINCWMRRWNDKAEYQVYDHHFSTPGVRSAVAQRFEQAGWKVYEFTGKLSIRRP